MKIEKLLCLGDSLTEAHGVLKEKSWPSLLTKDLEITVVNAGVSGDTTSGMLSRLPHLIKEHKPSHLIVLGGTNDLFFDLNDNVILANIHAINRQARYANIQSIIGVITPSFEKNQLNLTNTNYALRIEKFQHKLKTYCITDAQLYIDFSEGMLPEHFLDDGLHPNIEGHEFMKDKAKEMLNTKLLF